MNAVEVGGISVFCVFSAACRAIIIKQMLGGCLRQLSPGNFREEIDEERGFSSVRGRLVRDVGEKAA